MFKNLLELCIYPPSPYIDIYACVWGGGGLRVCIHVCPLSFCSILLWILYLPLTVSISFSLREGCVIACTESVWTILHLTGKKFYMQQNMLMDGQPEEVRRNVLAPKDCIPGEKENTYKIMK